MPDSAPLPARLTDAPLSPAPSGSASRGARRVPELTAAVCPFLVAFDGAWRTAVPAREHRCGATDPPGRLPLEKQQSLCLATAHLDCPLFEAAAGLTVGSHLHEAARAAAELDPRAVPVSEGEAWRGTGGEIAEPPPFVRTNRPVPRTTPVILDRARPPLAVHMPQFRLPSILFGRSRTLPGDPDLTPGVAPQTRLEAMRAARSAARGQGGTPGASPSLARTDTQGAAGLADSPGPSGFTSGPVRAHGDDLAGIARSPSTPTGASRGVPMAGDGPSATGVPGASSARSTRPDASQSRVGGAASAPPRRPSASAVPPRTPSDGSVPGGSTRRYVPPGGPGGFRTLGRVGGPTGPIGGIRAAISGGQAQAALAGVMVLALVLVLVVRFSSGDAAGVAGSSSSARPSGAATARPSGPAASGVAPSGVNPSNGAASAKPSRTPGATKPAATSNTSPRATKSPPAGRTYRVRPGDTLSAIAARFGTTVAVLMRLNNITDPRALRVGQVLKLP